MNWQSALLIAFGYLLGSTPTSYLAGRLVRNIDLRQYGSGNRTGLENAVHGWSLFFGFCSRLTVPLQKG